MIPSSPAILLRSVAGLVWGGSEPPRRLRPSTTSDTVPWQGGKVRQGRKVAFRTFGLFGDRQVDYTRVVVDRDPRLAVSIGFAREPASMADS